MEFPTNPYIAEEECLLPASEVLSHGLIRRLTRKYRS